MASSEKELAKQHADYKRRLNCALASSSANKAEEETQLRLRGSLSRFGGARRRIGERLEIGAKNDSGMVPLHVCVRCDNRQAGSLA